MLDRPDQVARAVLEAGERDRPEERDRPGKPGRPEEPEEPDQPDRPGQRRA